MKNQYIRLAVETLAAAVFCGMFSVLSGVLFTWYYWQQSDLEVTLPAAPQYLLFSFFAATLSVLVPLLIFNFLKMKYVQRKVKRVRS